jgi:hypothetical protein
VIGIDQTGRDPSGWSLVGIYWDNIFYNSLASFREAWTSRAMGKPTRNDGMNSTWVGTDKTGPGAFFPSLPSRSYCSLLSFTQLFLTTTSPRR